MSATRVPAQAVRCRGGTAPGPIARRQLSIFLLSMLRIGREFGAPVTLVTTSFAVTLWVCIGAPLRGWIGADPEFAGDHVPAAPIAASNGS
jgi:hypothetical protein